MVDNKKKVRIGTIVAAILIGIGFSAFFLLGDAQLETYDGPPRAVIIDQLHDEMPNEKFHTKATEYFEAAGYTVDIVTTKDVTVDFYKELPKMNYKFVVVRTHGAENSDDVVLFTGEKYSEEQYIQEQLFGQVKKATPLLERIYKVDDTSSEWVIVNSTFRYLSTPANPIYQAENEYFAIAPKLVSDAMNGKFDDTVFILGGCNTLSNPSLARSLIERGASSVLGWDNSVGNSDNDWALQNILEKILVEEMPIEEAVDAVQDLFDPKRMPYPANFGYFSESNY